MPRYFMGGSHRTALILAALLGAGLAAACGSAPPTGEPNSTLTDDRPVETGRPTRTPTRVPPSPTATASPTATHTPRPTPGPGLSELLGTPHALAAAAQLDQAKDAYRDLADLYPHRAEPWLGLAGIALREGDSDAALRYFESAVEADSASREAYSQWALLLEQLGQYDEALSIYDRMVQQFPDQADLLIARATAAARVGRANEAVSDLQAAQQLDPYIHFAWLNAAAAASGSRYYGAAVEIASAGLNAHPESVSLHIERGLALLSQGDERAALEDFDAAIELNEMSYVAFLWRGRALARLGQTDDAIADLQHAGEVGVQVGVASASQVYEAMADAADLLAGSGKVEEAFSYLADQVIRHGSQDALLMGYARVDWRRGNTELALGRLAGLVRDGYIPALYWRAVVLAEEGDEAQARNDLYAFLAVRRSGPQVEEARALVQQLGGDPDAIPAGVATPGAPPTPPSGGGDD